MARWAVADSNILLGASIDGDEHSEVANPIFEGIEQGDLPQTCITDYVLAEVLNALTTEYGTSQPDKVLDFVHRLESSKKFRMVFTDRQTYLRARDEIFPRYGEVSLVDATIVSFMKEYHCTYLYSVDDDFDRFDHIRRLNADANPFD